VASIDPRPSAKKALASGFAGTPHTAQESANGWRGAGLFDRRERRRMPARRQAQAFAAAAARAGIRSG
jgi:hypothetical protein